MAITAAAALWFLPFAAPIAIWVAWNDMRFMKIPNQAVVALTVVFLVIGLIALPLSDYPWRLGQLVLVLVVGFVMNVGGLVGAGDAKFAAAAAPFVAPGDLRLLMALFAAALLAAFVTHRGFGLMRGFRARTAEWESWARRDFPMGLALGGTLLFYLLLGAIFGA